MQGARTGSHNYSILQGKSKRCYFTDTETGPLERHHIYFGAGMRQISDKHGFWVWLKPEWHRGTSGVHGRDCPCCGCQERAVGCHGTCDQYKTWDGKRQAEKLERFRRTSILHEADKRKSAAVSHYKRRGRQI